MNNMKNNDSILFLITAIIILLPLYAADTVDLSPEGCMARLRADEAQITKILPRKKERCYGGATSIGSHFISQCMKDHNTAMYFAYFNALSISKISDEIKITPKFVMIPFFIRMHEKSEEEQIAILNSFVQEKLNLHYALLRLFFAGLSHAIDVHTINDGIYGDYMLCAALDHEDTSLANQLLAQGANANGFKDGYSTLWWCKRPLEAELLIAYKADVIAQHQHNDLIEALCTTPPSDEREIALMRFYLRLGRELCNEKNNFGTLWLEKLKSALYTHRYAYNISIYREKIKLLLQFGHYDAKNAFAKRIAEDDGKFCPHLVEGMIDGYLKKSSVSRLHNRSITGKHFLKVTPIVMKHKKAGKHSLEYLYSSSDQE